MTLKVIGAGFGRTGTASAYTALKQLGFPCYHMFEVRANKAHIEFWRTVAHAPEGTQHDWKEVFTNYTAAVDNPACCVWRELIAAYPDAKVLLTLHPKGPDAWYESTIETIYLTESSWQFAVLRILTPFGRRIWDMNHHLIWERSHKGTMRSREAAIAFYQEHIEAVKSAVPANRLLVYSVDQGWEPLCKFLDVPVPTVPFPNVNDREEFKKGIDKVNRLAYCLLMLVGAAVVTAAYGVIQILNSRTGP